MTTKLRNLISYLFAMTMLMAVIAGCGDRRASDIGIGKNPGFNPDTEIDTLYAEFAARDEKDMVIYANRLFAAFNEEELTDSLIQFSSSDKPQTVCANADYWMGEYLYSTSRPSEAIELADKALKVAEETGDESLALSCYSLLAACYQRLGRLEDAVSCMEKCYEQSSRSGDQEALSSDLNNLAALSLQLKRYEIAKTYIDKSIEIEKKLRRDDVLAVRYGIASEVYLAMDRLGDAEDFARRAYELDKRGGRDAKAAVRLSQLAAVLIAMGDRDDAAIAALREAIPALTESGNLYSLAVAQNQLGNLYMRRGDNREASQNFMAAHDVAQESGNLYQYQIALEGLSKSLRDIDLGSAYGYLAESAAVADSIYKLSNKARIAEIEKRYEQTALQRESERQALENRVQRYVGFGIIMFSLLVIGVLFYIIRTKNRSQAMQRSVENMRTNFFTNITHEFRTPITAILGLGKDIRDGKLTESGETEHAADIIVRQGQGLLNLVNQLLDISKIKSQIGAPDWCHGNVVSYVEMLVEGYLPTARSRQVDLVFSSALTKVEIDFVPDYIRKIVNNLLSNALKYSKPGGNVYLELMLKGNDLVIRVSDEGRGISADDLPHIFEPFYMGEGTRLETSTGVGLSLVSQLVEALGGEIRANSEVGKGSIFTVTLPIVTVSDAKALESGDVSEPFEPSLPDEDADGDTPLADDAEVGSKPVVLIVEDNNGIAYYIGSQLKKSYELHYARNGEDGLAKAEQIVPDIIITDLMMPEMDGLEMTARIRQSELVNHVPIIVITARSSDEDRVKGFSAGVDAYLTKPFNSDELCVRVENLLEQRRLLREKYSLTVGEGDGAGLSSADKDFLRRVADCVVRGLTAGRGVDANDCASSLCISPRQFSRKVQALTGDTPTVYISRIKISRAKRLLDSNPEMPITEVSLRCGYDDSSYFSRTF